MASDTLDLDEIERLAKEADTREDHPGYTDDLLWEMNDYLTPARALRMAPPSRRDVLDAVRALLRDPDGCGSRYCHEVAARAMDEAGIADGGEG